jgi:hypothetical protein
MGALDIGLLRPLVAAAKQNHQNLAALHVVDAIAGAVIDAHLHDALPHGLAIPGIAIAKPVHTIGYPGPCSQVPQALKPRLELTGLPNFRHQTTVS